MTIIKTFSYHYYIAIIIVLLVLYGEISKYTFCKKRIKKKRKTIGNNLLILTMAQKLNSRKTTHTQIFYFILSK